VATQQIDEFDLDLARFRARARKRIAEREGLSSGERFAAGFSRGVATTVGLPVDLINMLLGAFALPGGGQAEPPGGGINLQRGLERFDLGVAPEEELGRAGTVGQVAGAAATAGPAIVAGGIRSAAAQTLLKQPSIAGRVVQDVAQTAIKGPGRFVAGEQAAAVGAGLALFEAAQRFPDSPGAQALAEIGGGFTPAGALGLTRLTLGLTRTLSQKIPLIGSFVVRQIRGIRSAFTVKGGVKRAEQRIERTGVGLEESQLLGREDILPEAPLTVAQRIENEGLLALEKSVMTSSDELTTAHHRQFAEVNRVIRQSLKEPFSKKEVPTHQVKEYFESLLDTRIRQAAVRADERLAELGPRATREDLNRFARQELIAARSAARTQERDLYSAIPESAQVPTKAGQESLDEFLLSTPRAQRGDIPAEAMKFLRPEKLNAKGKVVPNKAFLGDDTTINEIRGLQSKLRETARIARSEGRFNRARISDDIAEALKADIGNATDGPEVREAVDIAVGFSSDFNDRFTRGAVGKLLGKGRGGGDVVPEGMTLETTVGKRGPASKVETDALLRAVQRSGDEPAMRGHIEGFLIDSFRRAAVSDRRVDVKAAQGWLDNNQDVLSRFPELRRSIEQAKITGGQFNEAQRIADPKVSRAAVFINAAPGQEIDRILQTASPRKSMQELVSLARQDPTGQAEQGLKAAFTNRLLRESEINIDDLNDFPITSGSRLTREMEAPATVEAMKGLFNKAEMNRLNQTRQTAILVERARKSPKALEGILGDEPGVLIQLIARIGGAQVGRVLARATGGGTVQTPGILSNQARSLIDSGVHDPAARLITDAIQDESLFKTLLISTKTPEGKRLVRTRLNAWVVDVLAQQQAIETEKSK